MSAKLEHMIWLRDTGHIGIHGGVDRRTVTKTKFSLINGLPEGYHIFLTMVLCACAPLACAELHYYLTLNP